MTRSSRTNAIYITGLGHKYPSHSVKQEDFEGMLQRVFPDETSSPASVIFIILCVVRCSLSNSHNSIQKLIRFNNKTRILSRPTTLDFTKWTKENSTPPDIESISCIFRIEGVRLATSACKEAMREARLGPNDITHTVAVTCTDQSNPGYDLFVCKELGLKSGVQRVLLHGVGCAGGLSALRAAADIAAAASQRGRPARVLVMACELCSLSIQAEVHAACKDNELHVAPALFSDGAAALVVCNGLALEEKQKPVFELIEWDSMMVPGTSGYISYDIEKHGMSLKCSMLPAWL
jgi:type III polyketide synthase